MYEKVIIGGGGSHPDLRPGLYLGSGTYEAIRMPDGTLRVVGIDEIEEEKIEESIPVSKNAITKNIVTKEKEIIAPHEEIQEEPKEE